MTTDPDVQVDGVRGTLNPTGPNHCANWSGSVNALYTRSRGASNALLITSSVAAMVVSLSVLSIIVRFLLLLMFDT